MNLPLEVVAALFFGAHLFLFVTALRSRHMPTSARLLTVSVLGSSVLLLMNAGVALWGIVGIFVGGSNGFALLGIAGMVAIGALIWGMFTMFDSFNRDQGLTEGQTTLTA